VAARDITFESGGGGAGGDNPGPAAVNSRSRKPNDD
jgi:hypothetical protein